MEPVVDAVAIAAVDESSPPMLRSKRKAAGKRVVDEFDAGVENEEPSTPPGTRKTLRAVKKEK